MRLNKLELHVLTSLTQQDIYGWKNYKWEMRRDRDAVRDAIEHIKDREKMLAKLEEMQFLEECLNPVENH